MIHVQCCCTTYTCIHVVYFVYKFITSGTCELLEALGGSYAPDHVKSLVRSKVPCWLNLSLLHTTKLGSSIYATLHCLILPRICNLTSWIALVTQLVEHWPTIPVVTG